MNFILGKIPGEYGTQLCEQNSVSIQADAV